MGDFIQESNSNTSNSLINIEELKKEYYKNSQELNSQIVKYDFDSTIMFVYNQLEWLRDNIEARKSLFQNGLILTDDFEEAQINFNNISATTRIIIERTCYLDETKSQKEFTQESYIDMLNIAMHMADLSNRINYNRILIPYFQFTNMFSKEATENFRIPEKFGPDVEKGSRMNEYKAFTVNMVLKNKARTELSQEMKDSYGFSLESYFIVLRGLIEFLNEKTSRVNIVKGYNQIDTFSFGTVREKEEPLIEYLLNLTRLSRDEIVKVMTFSLLNSDSYKKMPVDLWSISSRPNRLTVKPLIRLKNQEIILGWNAILDTARTCINILSGKWLFSENFVDRKLKLALLRLSQAESKRFEGVVYDEISKKADIILHNLSEERAKGTFLEIISKSDTSDHLIGEIDTFAIFKTAKKIAIFEAKDLAEKFGAEEIINQFNDFDKRKNFIEKLELKRKFIEKHEKEILSFFNIEDEESWSVFGCFILPGSSLIKSLLKVGGINIIGFNEIKEFINF